jgi:hypothetical protein
MYSLGQYYRGIAKIGAKLDLISIKLFEGPGVPRVIRIPTFKPVQSPQEKLFTSFSDAVSNRRQI